MFLSIFAVKATALYNFFFFVLPCRFSMESEDAVAPEKLIEDLKLSEKQSSPAHHAYIPRVIKEGVSESQEDDDLFHDCKDSLESRVVEENNNSETDALEHEVDVDEKELLELEKNMSEEEKEVCFKGAKFFFKK